MDSELLDVVVSAVVGFSLGWWAAHANMLKIRGRR